MPATLLSTGKQRTQERHLGTELSYGLCSDSQQRTCPPLLTCACHCSRCWGRGLGHQLPETPLGQRNWPLRRFLQSGATGKVVKLVREREFTGELQKYTTDLRIQLLPAHSSKPSGSPSQGPDQQGPAAGGCKVYAVCTTV